MFLHHNKYTYSQTTYPYLIVANETQNDSPFTHNFTYQLLSWISALCQT